MNLSDLTVLTEAATGNYVYTSIIAALAGAKKVYAYAKSSKYGSREEVSHNTMKLADCLGIKNIEVIFKKSIKCVTESDIITNSGFIRPINAYMIDVMKPTAVIPLMYDAWEFRPSDITIEKCVEKGILVLGTKESLSELYPTSGYLALKLLFESGLEVYKSNVLIQGDGIIGRNITKVLSGIDVNLTPSMLDVEAIIVSDLISDKLHIGEQGAIDPVHLSKINPNVKIIHICGNINADEVKRAGLSLIPVFPAPQGYMSYSADYLGPKFTIALNTASLKVGECMARCRLEGMNIKETIDFCLKNSPASELKGVFRNES